MYQEILLLIVVVVTSLICIYIYMSVKLYNNNIFLIIKYIWYKNKNKGFFTDFIRKINLIILDFLFFVSSILYIFFIL